MVMVMRLLLMMGCTTHHKLPPFHFWAFRFTSFNSCWSRRSRTERRGELVERLLASDEESIIAERGLFSAE